MYNAPYERSDILEGLHTLIAPTPTSHSARHKDGPHSTVLLGSHSEGEYKCSVLGEYSWRRALKWKLRITESFHRAWIGTAMQNLKVKRFSPYKNDMTAPLNDNLERAEELVRTERNEQINVKRIRQNGTGKYTVRSGERVFVANEQLYSSAWSCRTGKRIKSSVG